MIDKKVLPEKPNQEVQSNPAFIRCANFIADMIVKYGDKVLSKNTTNAERNERND